MSEKEKSGCSEDLGCLLIIVLLFLLTGGSIIVKCGSKEYGIQFQREYKCEQEK